MPDICKCGHALEEHTDEGCYSPWSDCPCQCFDKRDDLHALLEDMKSILARVTKLLDGMTKRKLEEFTETIFFSVLITREAGLITPEQARLVCCSVIGPSADAEVDSVLENIRETCIQSTLVFLEGITCSSHTN